MAGRLQDKIAIITGAGRGIGAATARRFVEEGAKVVIADVNGETGESTAAQLRADGYTAIAVQTDVSDHDAVRRMVAATVEQLGPPTTLVNNASVNVFRDPLKLTDEEWRRCFAVDLDSMWYCSREVLPYMLANGGGSIVNLASVHAFNIIPGCFPYPVAKHAVIGLTRALAIEYAANNIRVNAICPGYIETQITIDYWNTHPDPEAQRLYTYNLHPPKRIGTAEEVAAAVVFLASDEAAFVNAACLVVDGGRSVLYHE
ncbi:MAG: SDR family oxidoreductase [Anaerolineales bacterium]|nr:SDR family oxidoreductase [Anaerolineales bacterium]